MLKRHQCINYGSQCPRVSRCGKKNHANLVEEKKNYQGLFFKPTQSKSSDKTESTIQEVEKTVKGVVQ